MRRLLLPAVALTVLAARTPATARADLYTFAGVTSQSRRASVTVHPDGGAKFIDVGWSARCRRPSFTYSEYTTFSDFSGGSRFAVTGVGRLHTRLSHGERAAVTVRMAGRRRSPYVWAGSIAARVVVRRAGRVVDVCRLRRATWRATIPHVHLTVVTDAGLDPLARPTPLTLDTATPGSADLYGTRRGVIVGVGDFQVGFSAGRHHRLRPGTYANAAYPPRTSSPVVDIEWGSNECTWGTGAFTIHAIRFDRRGHVRSIAADFEERCENSPAATQGSLTARWP